MQLSIRSTLTPIVACLMMATPALAQNKVPVYILAGQSNMQGHGRVEDGATGPGTIGSLRYMTTTDPANYGHLVDGSNNWVTRSDVYVSTLDGPRNGGLSVGYGVNTSRIGPELGFGSVIGDTFTEDVLIIKTAWGGKSLKTDFRPPSAVQKRGGEVGAFYNQILTEVEDALANIANLVPGYAGQGYELKGFGWHQGFNDRIDQSAVNEYEANLVDFINDIRFDLVASDLPFVVANTGIGGPSESNQRALDLMQAQLNVADPVLYPQFDGNVKAVDTQPMWRDASVSPVTNGSQGFHWNGNGETMYLIGDGMGTQMATMSDYVQFSNPFVTVDQQTGEITLINPAENLEAMDLEALQINSAVGALDASNWTAIAGNYDGNGNSLVDSGNWTVDSATTSQLSESAVPGGDDGSLAIGTQISLGVGAWIQNLTRDLTASYTDTDGNVIQMVIQYLGDDNVLADLNTDGTIDIGDWAQFIAGAQTDMSALSAPQAYQSGDLDGDMDNDLDDFRLFKAAFEAANPTPGAFQAMLEEHASVPEPSSLLLFAGGLVGIGLRRSCRRG